MPLSMGEVEHLADPAEPAARLSHLTGGKKALTSGPQKCGGSGGGGRRQAEKRGPQGQLY